MDASMEDEHQQHQEHEQEEQQQQQQQQQQHAASGAFVDLLSKQQPTQTQHAEGQQQHHAELQQQQPPPGQQDQASKKRSKASRHRDLQEEGPNVDKWWLSESEDEDGSAEERQLLGHPEDPLYDPDADDADESWAQQQRSGRTTDAILSCPGCFTTLCIDCQQHELYHTQYRAMFTQNCEVKVDELMHSQVERQQQRGRKRRVGAAGPQQLSEEGGVLHPVCCAVCGTKVGAQDADEIVHFFHVLASEC